MDPSILTGIGPFIKEFGFPILVALYFMWKDHERDKREIERDKRQEKLMDMVEDLLPPNRHPTGAFPVVPPLKELPPGENDK